MRTRTWKLALLAAVLAGMGGLTACGGSGEPQVPSAAAGKPTSPAPGGDEVARYVEGQRKWVACLRQQGLQVSDPDPTGLVAFAGDMAKLKADPSFEKSLLACKSLEQSVPESVMLARRPPLTSQQIDTARKYATCMQTNGAADFPDPGPDGYPPRGSNWSAATADAQRATRACASIIGDPTTDSTGVG
jgi:hypothetical protein